MAGLHRLTLPYPEDVAELFAVIVSDPWAIWLDSGPDSGRGRFDILLAAPYATLCTQSGITQIHTLQGEQLSHADPFSLLRQFLAIEQPEAVEGVPFAGGAAGLFSYDLGRLLETLPMLAEDDLRWPQLQLGLYDWAVIVDHHEQRCELVSWFTQVQTRELWPVLAARFSMSKAPMGQPFIPTTPLHSNLDFAAYEQAFARIKSYLREGDCYQVNFAQRFDISVSGDPFISYCHLRRQSPAPFGAYLNLPEGQVLCNSPERFLQVQQGAVHTAPIKGTRPRLPSPEADRSLADALRHSQKDRAENLMIVDLLRNDLAKACRLGSVKVPALFEVESYATVHQLVSHVTGELRSGQDAVSLLRHCFPGGSITGAPKLRAMAIIEELEPQRRGFYCGAIGYLGFDGNMDTNIAIRTALHRDGQLWFSAGGGIVHDSACSDEYQETFDKATAFLRLLGLTTKKNRYPLASSPPTGERG